MSIARCSSLVFVLSLAFLAACGGRVDSPAHWTFTVEARTDGSKPAAPKELAKLIRERIPRRWKSVTRVECPDEHTLVIEGPLQLDLPDDGLRAALARPVRGDDVALELMEPDHEIGPSAIVAEQARQLDEFPLNGGYVLVDREWIGYAARVGRELRGLARGAYSTLASAHERRAIVLLADPEELARMVSLRGELGILFEATCTGLALPTDLNLAGAAKDTWFTDHPGASLDDYALVPPNQGGAPEGTRWLEHRSRGSRPNAPPVLLRAPDKPFTDEDLERVEVTTDELGYPALHIELSKGRRKEFEDLSARLIHCGMAIVIDGRIVTLATVQDRLPGLFVLSGGLPGFTQREVDGLAHVLSTGRQPVTLRLVGREPRKQQ